jgi:glycosyltransferase involved in cell wall biosynthesis
MPAFNSAKFISKSIESVLNQTFSSWELIIIDDCSVDNTREVINKYLIDKRIKLVSNLSNQGVAKARNIGILNATYSFISFLDSDDIWDNNKLYEQYNFMVANNLSFTSTDYSLIDENCKNLDIKV